MKNRNSIYILIIFIFGMIPMNGFCHVNDEVAIRTSIFFKDDFIALELEIDAGILFGQYYLEILDPDKNGSFRDDDVREFSEFVLSGLRLRMNGDGILPEFAEANCASFEEFAAGFCYVKLCYRLPYPEELDRICTFYYENCLEAEVAIYTLMISDDGNSMVKIVDEERNEMLQDFVTVKFCGAESAVAYTSEENEIGAKAVIEPIPDSDENKEQQTLLPETEFGGSAVLINRIKTGGVNIFVLVALAVVIGFLHAFTPGHGKSLVGAYLIANQGTVLQALGLGVIVTLTHTASIYVFGGLASAATYFFMPARVVPVMTIVSGVLVVVVGIWSVLRRLTGREVDHAHILPNLKVLKEDYINILVDGNAVDSSELLAIESEEHWVIERLEAAGAEGINICSPGCESHNIVPAIVAERQNAQIVMMAVETGAVDAVVSGRRGLAEKLQSNKTLPDIDFYQSVDCQSEADDLLRKALLKYEKRDGIIIPEDGLSWKKLIPLGIAGGAVPCPDALAILLISFSMGKLALGLGIVFAFSAGLAAALVIIGITIVFSNNMIAGTRGYRKIAGYIPYISALFLIGVGIYMIVNNIGF